MSVPASRRGFLRGIATVSALGGTVALPAIVRAQPAPDLELLQLGRELDDRYQKYLALVAEKEKRIARFRGIEPALPDAITRRGSRYPDQIEFHGECPPNHDGRPCGRATDHRVRVLWPYEAEQLTERYRDGRLRITKRYRYLRRECEAFHKAHAEAREMVGLPAIEEARYFQGRAVAEVAFKVAAQPAVSLAGLSVKGRAGLAQHEVWFPEGGMHLQDGHAKLLKNLVAIGEAQS